MTNQTLVASVAAYCAIHSFMADAYLMGRIYRLWWYRTFYVLVSFILILPVVYVYSGVEKQPFFNPPAAVSVFLYTLWLPGLWFGYYASKSYDNGTFLGLTQIKNYFRNTPEVYVNKKLSRSGALSIVRHPYYSVSFIFIWSRPMNLSDFYITLVLSAYFLIGTINEERKLVKEFGSDYIQYKKEVPALVPDFRKLLRL